MPSKLDRIYVRITPQDREKIDQLCEVHGGMSASALIRVLIGREYLQRWPELAPKKTLGKSSSSRK